MADKEKNTRSAASKERYFQAGVALVTVLLFFGILIGLGCVTTFSEKESFSENQNKALASFPKFSGKRLFNGSFTSGLETYVSDHFAWHDEWITAQTYSELALGKKERNNVYFMKNGGLAEKISEPDMTVVGKSISGIQQFASDNGIMPYIMIVPTQAEIYSDMLPTDAPNPDQAAFINNVYSQLDGYAVPIDVYSVLSANRDDYIYYRTDHHWTTRGAFLGYTAAAKKMGIYPLSEDFYDVEHASDKFRGTFYSKVLYNGIKPDTIDIWHLSENETQPEVEIYSTFGEEPTIHDGMYFREYLDVKDKYSTFFGTNQPMITIRTGHEGGKLLMFKDSYAHCFAPFITEHYSEITMVDLRYIQISYKELIDVSDYDQVLFLYNASTFMSDENIKKLSY